MTEYFEDMWLSLEKELSSFDSFTPSDYVSSPSSVSDPNSPNNMNSTNLDPQTYEGLLEIQLAPPPSNDKLRSADRKERIQAIRELYNKTPTIINGSSLAILHKTASALYKRGLVKQANSILAAADSAINENFNYVTEEDGEFKSLSVNRVDGELQATVQISDKTDKGTMTKNKTFDNLLDAIKYFKE